MFRNLATLGDYVAVMLGNFVAWIGFVAISWVIPAQFQVERQIWIVVSLFFFLQPTILLLMRPQRVRMRIRESIRQVIYVLYSFVYVIARLSVLFTALYSIRKAMQ